MSCSNRLRVVASMVKRYDEDVSVMKLQKLLYIIQETSLEILNKKAFKEDFEIDGFGPYLEGLMQEIKENKDFFLINIPNNYLDEGVDIIVDKVLKTFAHMSVWNLMKLTQNYFNIK